MLPALLTGVYLARHPVVRMQIGSYQRLTNDGFSKDFRVAHAAIIQDKNLLFFSEAKDNETILAQVSTAGGGDDL